MATLEQMLTDISADLKKSGKRITMRPTKIIYRPEDITRIAKMRGVSEQTIRARLERIIDAADEDAARG